jgi:phage terminase large subunit
MADGIYDSAEDPDYDSSLGDVLVIECNHTDNPWFTKELKRSMLKMKERDYDRYMWIWEGKFNKKSNEQVIHGKWQIEEFEADTVNWDGPYFGADFGFAQDPSTLIKMWIDPEKERLMIEYEAWGIGVELDDMAKFYAGKEGANEEELEDWDDYMDEEWPGIPGAKDDDIYGDCSRPETISHIKKRDFYMYAGEKWAGSVEDGIAYLRSFDAIIIHPRCVETIKEAELYKHKVDKLTEEILPAIVDKHNHCWDAIRYGLSKRIKQMQSFFDV